VHRGLCRNQISILTYHGIVREPLAIHDSCFLDARSFIEQIAYLRRHFDVVPLREAMDRLREGRVRRPTVVLTFDDGYENNQDLAWPVLRQAGVPATIFLTTDLIDTTDMIWSCRLHRAITDTRRTALAWNGAHYDLSDARSRTRAATALKRALKTLPPARLRTELAALVRALGDAPDRPVERDSPFRMLSSQAIHELAHSGLIDFGAHTCSHAILSTLDDAECRREVADSVAVVAQLTARACTLFAYPNGRSQDYTAASVAMLASCGIDTAVTMIRRQNTASTPPLELGRLGVRAGVTRRGLERLLDRAFLDAPAA
jgi:peptidoglycan/xylan/chitin deacetylase (PgdA/CDA1 family)